MEIYMKKLALILSVTTFFLAVPAIAYANPVVNASKGIGYAVTEVNEENFTVTMPVPGLTKPNIQATMKGNVLTIVGTPTKEQTNTVYRGFQPAAFTKRFTLKKGTDVSKVTLSNGLLLIDLKIELPDDQKTVKFNIN
jgi:HSP20 family molecular chaperone IbpA